MFLKYNYAETKDLAKSFLTLSSGILAFSVAFSEKVIDFKNTRGSAKLAMGSFWTLIVLSIIIFISVAGGQAVYGGNYNVAAQRAYLLLLISGVAFAGGLISLVVSAIISLTLGPPPPLQKADSLSKVEEAPPAAGKF